MTEKQQSPVDLLCLSSCQVVNTDGVEWLCCPVSTKSYPLISRSSLVIIRFDSVSSVVDLSQSEDVQPASPLWKQRQSLCTPRP